MIKINGVIYCLQVSNCLSRSSVQAEQSDSLLGDEATKLSANDVDNIVRARRVI